MLMRTHSVGTHCVAITIHANANKVTNFDSFGVENMYQNKLEKLFAIKTSK